MTALAFTGHRPNRFSFGTNEDAQLCIAIKKKIERLIDRCYRERAVHDVYVGGALGVDMWAAEAALSLKEIYPDITVHCIIPFEGHDSKWQSTEKKRLEAICAKSDVMVLASAYHENAYRVRNEYMVDHCTCLVAVFAQNNGFQTSGTAQTVNYATRIGKPIIFIHPDTAVQYLVDRI